MKKEHIIIFLLILVIIGGFVYFKSSSTPSSEVSEETVPVVQSAVPTTPTETTVAPKTTTVAPKTTTTVKPAATSVRSTTVKLLPKGDFGQSGTVTISEVSSTRTKVVIRLDGVQTGTSRPVNFRKNRCDKFEEIIPITGFAPINNGYSSSIVGASFDSIVYNKKYPYSIVVQKSQTESQTPVACGDIWGVVN